MSFLAGVLAFVCCLSLAMAVWSGRKARQERVARLVGREYASAPPLRRRRVDPQVLRRDLALGVLGALGGFSVVMACVGSLPLAVAGMAVGVLAPRWFESRRKAAREAAFSRQLEGAVSLMASVLRAGGSLEQAVGRVAERYGEPLGPEFARALKEARAGRPCAEAVAAIEERVPIPEMRVLAVAVTVCSRTGGDLASLMDRTAEAVRSRRQVAQMFRAFTAQGRMQATVIGLAPLGMLGVLRLVVPSMLDPLLKTPWGQVMLYFCFGWMALGWWVISRMVAPPREMGGI